MIPNEQTPWLKVFESRSTRLTQFAVNALTQLTATIRELDPEAHFLAYRLEDCMNEKRWRDFKFEIRLLKGEIEKRKKCSRGVPPAPSPEERQEQRERDAEEARKDLKCKQVEEKHQREVRAWALGRLSRCARVLPANTTFHIITSGLPLCCHYTWCFYNCI